MNDIEEIKHLETLLETYRRRVVVVVLKRKVEYDLIATPPHMQIEVDESRSKIKDIKAKLRSFGVIVEEDPIDQPTVIWHPLKLRDDQGDDCVVVPPAAIAPEPPVFALRLLRHLPMDGTIRDAVEGDLTEGYSAICKKAGRRKADLWYCRQVLTSCWPFIVNVVRKAIEKVRRQLG